MDATNISEYLGTLLGLPAAAIFDDDGQLTSLCLLELNSAVDMPVGFFLTEAVRVPKVGEYFLDAKALIEKDRLVVYKAIGSLRSVGLILQTENEASTYVDGLTSQFGDGSTIYSSDWGDLEEDDSDLLDVGGGFFPNETPGFSWSLCELHGGCALFHGEVIELLSNYVDPNGVVAGINTQTKNLILASTKELKNLSSNITNPQPPHPLALPFANLLASMTSPPKTPKHHKPFNIPKPNRMNIKFKEPPPPGLDDLLNDLF